ncbi:hypothetical protein CYY_001018 [Polysphondylium violaceum]|uniref:Uncharacterized protein n=1 Tax=Polysphondylium violaceum TaxID=133409 RepID=A0A8J4UWN0_9MYCE|nr:hypothetical protein CYY_001018 [Polysphondylium violaceum]
MTVLLEQQQHQSEIENKVFKVLLAFSQSIEKSLINNQNTLLEAQREYNTTTEFGSTKVPESHQLDQAITSNVGLYTVHLVRNVIKRSDQLSRDFSNIISDINQQNAHKEKLYKDEIEYLKSQLHSKGTETSTLTANTPTARPPSVVVEQQKQSPVDSPNTSMENLALTSSSTSTSKKDSSLSVSSLKELNADWDTKHQTEMQLNAMLSEFLKDDFEISNDASFSSSPMISTTPTTTSHQNLASSGSFTPNHLNSSSPALTHTSSSFSIEGSPSRNNSQKKAMLTDLLDQIDLESTSSGGGGASTPSKQKKGKFKFF